MCLEMSFCGTKQNFSVPFESDFNVSICCFDLDNFTKVEKKLKMKYKIFDVQVMSFLS